MQMSVHSTLGSYLQRLIWILTGNFGRKGTNNAPLPFVSLTGASKGERRAAIGEDRNHQEEHRQLGTESQLVHRDLLERCVQSAARRAQMQRRQAQPRCVLFTS